MIAKSGIDVLSYAALHPDEHTRNASTGGAMNPSPPALIRAAIEKMGEGARIVAAMDNDAPGRDLADRIEAIAHETGRADLSIARHLPDEDGMDWNDCLRTERAVCPPEPAALP